MKSVLALLCLTFLLSCGEDESANPALLNIPTDKGHESLSEYNFFVGDLNELNPNDQAGVIPYDLNMPLFSDYASKKRFIYIPDGSQIPYKEVGTLNLPVGSILIKHFYYEKSAGDEYIETRLLIRKATGWQPEVYIWNDEQTEAFRSVIGARKVVEAELEQGTETFNYQVPNQNQCKNCHSNNGKIEPIGPNIPNLNKEYHYEEGSLNQLAKWNEEGILELSATSELSSWPTMIDAEATLTDKSRAYLASNCSSCHRRSGSAANSGLYLEFENTDSLSLGFWKTPVAAGDGSGGLDYVIKPGAAEESILWFRMNSRDVEVRMPELGRELIHDDGVDLIKNWIDAME